MEPQHKSALLQKPKRTALGVAVAFMLLIVLGIVGFSLLFNAVQQARRTTAEEAASQRGEVVNPADLDRLYPMIDFF